MARYLDIGDAGRAAILFKAIREASLLEEEIPRRLFSQRVLGFIKAFDKVKSAVARAAVDFNADLCRSGVEGPDEILAELGIVDNPQHIFIGGDLKFKVADRLINVAYFYPDLGIATEMIGRMEIVAAPVDFVVTIENLTAFYGFIKAGRRNCLAVYLGGYHNPIAVTFC